MSNLLIRIERYIKRPKIAEMIKTNETYLSVLANNTKLTEGMEERLRKAVRKTIKDLEKIIKEK